MRKFEYKAVYYDKVSKRHEEMDILKLNELGDEGWELVTIIGGQAIFKREKDGAVNA